MKQVHGSDLIGWAMEKAKEIQFEDFKASYNWLSSWKKTHGIVRRKINKRFTRKEIDEKPQVDQSIKDFVSKIRSLISVKNPPKLFNADEAGYAYELKFNFTLEHKGSRYVKEKIDSKNAKTHSYTSLPIVDDQGNFVTPHLIILQEPNGVFGPQVEKKMFKHKDLLIKCSKSGKMTKPILAEWYKKGLFGSRALHNNIFLFDSFPMHKDPVLFKQNKPRNYNLQLEFIPPGTTDRIQPLDNNLNRTFKDMVRQLSELYCTDTDSRIERKRVSNRDNICLIQLLMYNQCSSPRFKGWVQYSFYACGYKDSYSPFIASPIGYCFKSSVNKIICDKCEGEGDYKSAKIRCAWCTRHFCAFHFFFDENYHYCKRYIPD